MFYSREGGQWTREEPALKNLRGGLDEQQRTYAQKVLCTAFPLQARAGTRKAKRKSSKATQTML